MAQQPNAIVRKTVVGGHNTTKITDTECNAMNLYSRCLSSSSFEDGKENGNKVEPVCYWCEIERVQVDGCNLFVIILQLTVINQQKLQFCYNLHKQ